MQRYGAGLLAAASLFAAVADDTLAAGMDRTAVTLSYFEIPVSDMDRAMSFYSAVFGIDLARTTIDGYEMALFPEGAPNGAPNGALAKGDVYVPGKAGPVIYFHTPDIDGTIKRAVANGGSVLLQKQSVDDFGFVAEFEDSEGNRIALHEPLKTE
ncbi:MAG: VOC family protein [Pseudomonadota bacterium]